MRTWDEPEMFTTEKWGPWDWAWVGTLVFGAGCLVGAIITMSIV